jgi:hypothetical protein
MGAECAAAAAASRLTGPMNVRFILQSIMAAIPGVLANRIVSAGGHSRPGTEKLRRDRQKLF